ncbi:MAG: hypothetical protein KC733_10110 [Candidatus Omnitrophica bacterium]|nr:hypothetical protein [Candidatus Omnitrophota bacterium]
MNSTDYSIKNNPRYRKDDLISDTLKEQVVQYSKDFKTSWVNLGQVLWTIWEDKIYYTWGYEKFEYFTEKEIGIKKNVALKLLKTYSFIEQNEPAYLDKEFSDNREALKVPGYEEINVLRLARSRKELNRDDFMHLKHQVFEKGKDAAAVRKDLTTIMKERKPVDPEEEREKRNEEAVRKLLNSLKSFKKDMDVLKLLPDEIVNEANVLLQKLESQIER